LLARACCTITSACVQSDDLNGATAGVHGIWCRGFIAKGQEAKLRNSSIPLYQHATFNYLCPFPFPSASTILINHLLTLSIPSHSLRASIHIQSLSTTAVQSSWLSHSSALFVSNSFASSSDEYFAQVIVSFSLFLPSKSLL
jgi:hypothetical protein